jgi:hypothetical protein
MLTMSTLPVRSPLPNRQPSTRSAPAISASSAVAVPVPRSLCGCAEMHDALAARDVAARPLDHVGVDVGRGMLHRRRQVDDAGALGVGCHTSVTASITRRDTSELGVGEHLRRILEAPVGVGLLRGAILDDACVAAGELDDAVHVQAQHDLAHHRCVAL